MSGCPVVATKDSAGNEDQVLSGNNGYIFDSTEDGINKIIHLVNNPELIKVMGRNAKIYSLEFSSKEIINKLLRFMDWNINILDIMENKLC